MEKGPGGRRAGVDKGSVIPAGKPDFFAAVEAQAVDAAGACILPIREEQLKERLGERFRELDVPLLVEWPDGRRAALLFVFEEETAPARFSIHRLAHDCLDLAEIYGTDRVVPIVICPPSGGSNTLTSSTSMPTWMTMNGSFTPNGTRTRSRP